MAGPGWGEKPEHHRAKAAGKGTLLINVSLKDRKTKKDRLTKNFLLLIHCPNARNSWDWAQPRSK